MARLAGVVIGMATCALLVAYLAFGWPVLVVGGPLLVGVATTLVVLAVTERPRRALLDRRSGLTAGSPWKTAAERGEIPSVGLMSGFFEISPQTPVTPMGAQVPAQSGSAQSGSALSGPSRPARPAGV